ncbi:MAG: multicopper oxidase domain-containing protein [Polyangiales bacterium]
MKNWRGLFHSGERIRLRFINSSAATFFDVRIPGLPMRVIAMDGTDIEPVETDEFRIAVAETVDVIVEPQDPAYTVFAEAVDRSGFTRGTLAVDESLIAPVPARRKRPLLTMTDMGMDHGGMDHGGMDHGGMDHGGMDHGGMDHGGMDHGGMDHGGMDHSMHSTENDACRENLDIVERHKKGHHGAGNSMVAQVARSRIDDPGNGLGHDGWRVLSYSQLRRATPGPPGLNVDRDLELHLTGNMERYMWSFDGVQYTHGMPDIVLKYGERVRFVLINDTMMQHPIHLHGMFFELDVGACEHNPLKHTVNVKPAERVSFVVTANEIGRWAFHCHILYHMDAGMMRVVRVTQ